MGSIVFSTIVENLKSFFGKEEALLAQPKAIPEAASEVYEHPTKQPPRIVERPLPKEQELKLPFSPDDLRAALKTPEKPPAPRVEEVDITHEINAFEHALQDAAPPQEPVPIRVAPRLTPAQEGFFDEFEQFILHEDLEADGLLEKDILHRMQEFHRHQEEGKEYYVYSKDVKQAIQRKLDELKTLEREWFHTRKEMDELERGMRGVEHEIEARVGEVRSLLVQAKSRSRLEQRVPAGQEFGLRDGRKLATLLDLKIALHTMPVDVFHHHVAPGRNDFAAWVRGTMHDTQLAADIDRMTDKHQLELYLSRLAG